MDSKREALKQQLFQKCDKDGDGFLNKAEMRVLAEHVGFEGSNDEWAEEYELLCSEHYLEPKKGITMGVIMNVLDDKSELGLYCSDSEICQLLGIEHVPAKAKANHDEGEDKDGAFVRVFFAGANFNTTEAILKSTFEEIGTVDEFTLFRLQDGRSMGMGRVKYGSHEHAQKALRTLHNREIDGRAVMLQVDQRGEDNEEGGGSAKRKGKDRDSGGKDAGKGKNLDMGNNKSGKGGKGDKGSSKKEWPEGGWSGESNGRYREAEDNGDHRTIFFAGASFDSTSDDLRSKFQEVGPVVQFWLFSDWNGYSRGMGVAQYRTARQANKAVEHFAGIEIDGRKLYVKIDHQNNLHKASEQSKGGKEGGKGGWKGGNGGKGDEWDGGWEGGKGGWKEEKDAGWKGGWEGGYGGPGKGVKGPIGGAKGVDYSTKGGDNYNQQSSRVFFSGAPFKVPPAAVQEHFAAFGEVRSLRMFKRSDGASRGMGVCIYHSAKAAEEAINYGIGIEGRSLFLGWDTSSGPEGKGDWSSGPIGGGKGGKGWDQDDHQDVDPNTSVYFRNVPFETAEKFLREKFGNVGAIKNFMLFTTPDGRSRGQGVVEYFTATAAERAYNEIHDMNVSGRQMHVDYYSV